MRLEWDEGKNRINRRKHGLDFSDAWRIFTAPMLAAMDDRADYGEDRWIGMLGDRVVVVAYTEPDDETVRIISLRRASSHERTQYEQALRDRQRGGD